MDRLLLRVGVICMGVSVLIAVGVLGALLLRTTSPVATPPSPLAEAPAEPTPATAEPAAEPVSVEEGRTVPALSRNDWPEPSRRDLEQASEPRRYDPAPWAVMTLTIDSIGLYDAPVSDSNTETALDRGVIHLPETDLPWKDSGAQRNVYLAGHRIGYPGTGSRMIFYNLDKVQLGDAIILKDRSGKPYEYRVTKTFVVDPYDSWVLDPLRNRDTVTLQTCTPIPGFQQRLIVRADRIGTSSSANA